MGITEFSAWSVALGLSVVLLTGGIDYKAPEPMYKGVDVDSTEAVDEYRSTMIRWCDKDVDCKKIAEALYFEARGEGREGMHAVANVIMNRAERRGRTPYQVITRPHQFSYIKDVKYKQYDEVELHEEAKVIAARAMAGILPDITDGSTHYLNPKKLSRLPRWARQYEETVVINDHVFYKGM